MKNIEMFMVNEQLKCGSLILSTIWNKIKENDKLKKEFEEVYSGYFICSEDDSLVFEWALCNNNIRASFDIERGHYNACWTIVSTKKYGFLQNGKEFLYCRENEVIQVIEEFIEKIQYAIEYAEKNK